MRWRMQEIGEDGQSIAAYHSISIFKVIAYQDTLGDFHNLLGRAHDAHVLTLISESFLFSH